MNSFLEKIKTTKMLACIGTLCMFLGTVIGYARLNVLGYTANVQLYKHFEGIIILIDAIVSFLFIFKDIVATYIPKVFESGIGKKISEMSSSRIALISTGIAVLMAIILHVRLDFSLTHFTLGFYLLYFGIICLGIYGIINRKKD